jgi:hypothetical protein
MVHMFDIEKAKRRVEQFTKTRGWGAAHIFSTLVHPLTDELGELNKVSGFSGSDEFDRVARAEKKKAFSDELADMMLLLLLINTDWSSVQRLTVPEESLPLQEYLKTLNWLIGLLSRAAIDEHSLEVLGDLAPFIEAKLEIDTQSVCVSALFVILTLFHELELDPDIEFDRKMTENELKYPAV